MSDFQQTITSLNLLHTSLYRMELFTNAQAVKNAKTDVISLISRLESVERERDELRAEQAEHDEQIARMESKFSLAKRALDSKTARCEKAETELRRRDAAAGEPYGYVHKSLYEAVGSAGLSNDHEAYRDSPTHIALYTAAQPAVVPPAMTYAEALKVSDWKNDQASIWVEGANWMRQQCLELGAQQQKVVQLPAASVPHGWKLVPLKAFPSQWAAGQKAFDAAGINKIDPVYHAMVEAAPAPGGDGG